MSASLSDSQIFFCHHVVAVFGQVLSKRAKNANYLEKFIKNDNILANCQQNKKFLTASTSTSSVLVILVKKQVQVRQKWALWRLKYDWSAIITKYSKKNLFGAKLWRDFLICSDHNSRTACWQNIIIL